jgi:hypothetical protein
MTAASAAYLNQAVERTGHTTGPVYKPVSVACGPPLTAGVRLHSKVIMLCRSCSIQSYVKLP